jgi:NAD(P)-dependent dehydrogenase (short-subunit alcohol dehydrogenase family)
MTFELSSPRRQVPTLKNEVELAEIFTRYSQAVHRIGVAQSILRRVTAWRIANYSFGSDCEALPNLAVERFGGLDCIVNNAGAAAEGGPIADISVEGFDRAIALLLRGTFLGIK